MTSIDTESQSTPPALIARLMISVREANLGALSSSNEHERTLVVHCHDVDKGSWLELRQQSWAGGNLGWVTQSSVKLDMQQLGELKQLLRVSGAQGTTRTTSAHKKSGFVPRIVRADSA